MEVAAAGRGRPGSKCTDRSRPKSRPAPGLRPVAANGPRCQALLGSSQCHTRHLSTGGVPRNGHVLDLNLKPMPTYASTGSVNSNPIMVARQETPSLADSNWVHSPHLNCSNSSFSLQALAILLLLLTPSKMLFFLLTSIPSTLLNTADTINNYLPKKSPEPAPGHLQRIPTASTPEQEFAVISRYLALAHQERLQFMNKTANLACKSSNEVGSTNLGRSHTCNAASKLPHDITSKILFSPIILCKENLLFASNERPTKKQRVSNDFNKEDIKNRDNNEVTTCDSFKIPAITA